MTLGSRRAPLLLIPFIKQPSCWFSSGPSQQALAQRRARGQRGFGQRRREVCSHSAAAFPASSTTYFQSCITPKSSLCLQNQPGQTWEEVQSKYILKLAQRNKETNSQLCIIISFKTHACVYPTKLATSITFPQRLLRCYSSIYLIVVHWHITGEEIMTRFIEMETNAPSPHHGWSSQERCMEKSPTGNQHASQTEHLWFIHYTQLGSKHHSSIQYYRVCVCF